MIVDELYDLQESSGYSFEGSWTPDLVFSKLWLIKELARIQPNISTMYVLGAWYGNLAVLIDRQNQLTVDHIVNVETDREFLKTSQGLMRKLGIDNVEFMQADANDLDYRQVDADSAVVNTSLTDMFGRNWFEQIPPGTLVAMQARDHDPGQSYSSVDQIARRFPLSETLYRGELLLEDPETPYTRYMLIGRR